MYEDANFADLLIQRRAKSQSGNDVLTSMADLTKDITTIDGNVYSQLLLSGAVNMMRNKPTLNKINVFPIADGDTGTNMVNCLKIPVRNLFADRTDDLKQASANLAADVVVNGQGNSGTILSHFFISLAEELRGVSGTSASMEEFAAAVGRAGARMNEAVANPVEGTMMSVARDSAVAASKSGATNLKDFCAAWAKSAKEEVALTPERLKDPKTEKYVLKEAGVVDSGAEGFANVVSGMLMACNGELTGMDDLSVEFSQGGITDSAAGLAKVDHNVTESKYQFCTEACIHLKDGMTKEDVQKKFEAACSDENLGDSLAFVGAPAKEGGDMVKVHIHSNNCQKVFDIAGEFSRTDILMKEKVEDMYEERTEAHETGKLYDMSKAKVRIMIDGAVLPPSYFQDDYCTLNPIWVMHPDGTPLQLGEPNDIISLANYKRHNPAKIGTAAPLPPQALIPMRKALMEHPDKHLLVIDLGSAYSAQHRNVTGAKKLLSEELQKRVTIIDSGYLGPNSLQALEALRCAEAGMEVDEIIKRIEYVGARLYHCFFLASPTVKALAKWGRVPALGDGSGVQDGQFFSMGCSLPEYTETPRTVKGKAMNFMGLLDQVDSSPTAQMDLVKMRLQKIKDALKPNQEIRDFRVLYNLRADAAAEVVKMAKEILPLRDEPYVGEGTLASVFLISYKEIIFFYWIDEKEE